jgi:hypothetical protein
MSNGDKARSIPAVKAGAAAIQSARHISKRQRVPGVLTNTSEIQEGRPQAAKRKQRRS